MVITRQFTKDALEYLKAVRHTFQDNLEIYHTFMKILKDLKDDRIRSCCVRSKVKDLFRGHQQLILDLDKFLPRCPSYKVTFESDRAPLKTPEYGEALEFVKRVKARLQDDRAYETFLEIMQMYSQDKKSVAEVYYEVFDVLFRDQHDLRVEFAYFFRRYKITPCH